jgi:hypothetical protein
MPTCAKPGCGVEFVARPCGPKTKVYCSRVCGMLHWALVNPERKKKKNNDAHRTRVGADHLHAKSLRLLYGLSVEDYSRMLASQGGVCKLCGSPPGTGRQKRLHVDHDHKTGKVRGLLCDHCNHALGKMKDDPVLLRKAAAYLEARHGSA